MVFNEFKALEYVFSELQPMEIGGGEYTPEFMYGTELDMLVWLNQKRKERNGIYPLIWIETPFTLRGKPFAEGEVNILLATLTTSNLSNIERTHLTFETTLDPLLEVVRNAINGYGGINFINPDEEAFTKYFNYNTNEDVDAPDIWDAIKFKCTLSFNLNCI